MGISFYYLRQGFLEIRILDLSSNNKLKRGASEGGQPLFQNFPLPHLSPFGEGDKGGQSALKVTIGAKRAIIGKDFLCYLSY